jgi:ssDNA-binding Zn-finger/Zn-ribbon topoisomerase 1
MINILKPYVYCPLCEEKMSKRRMSNGLKVFDLYMCKPCNIFTYPFDPAFDKWRDTDKKIPCPRCDFPEVKWFLRQMDSYLKFVCPKCKVIGEGDCNSFITSSGAVETDLMDSDQGEEVGRIEIPIDKMALSEEKKAGLKKKIREQKAKEQGNG